MIHEERRNMKKILINGVEASQEDLKELSKKAWMIHYTYECGNEYHVITKGDERKVLKKPKS